MAIIEQNPFTLKTHTQEELLEKARALAQTHQAYGVEDGQFVKVHLSPTTLKVKDLKKVFFVDPRISREQLSENLPYVKGPFTSHMPFHSLTVMIEKGVLYLGGASALDLAGYIQKNIGTLPFVARLDCELASLSEPQRYARL